MNGRVTLKVIGIPIFVFLLLLIFNQIFNFRTEVMLAILVSVTLVGYWQVFYLEKKNQK
ncbi:hypothetical protein [Jeotgalibacillus proteolyticus]|uniref:hypothetical protein n=1 Tax=Jeotgalibacillus proteolyticus TaxID=2082395 RepID=UPI0014316C32|nr:hypothetical protein [Jeotgalibacillus proteolyticus]